MTPRNHTFNHTLKKTPTNPHPNPIYRRLAKLRDQSSVLGQAATFGATTGTILGNSLLFGAPLLAAGALKTLTGNPRADKTVLNIAEHWITTNNYLINHLLPNIDLRVNLPANLSPTGRYILLCNHQSWVDTSVIQYIGQDRLPLTRFFAKHELLYIPIVGQAFYFLDFPMMKRYSKEEIAKNPTLKNRDIEEARRACQQLANKPFTLLNFVEGTRFTQQKRDAQQSPYAHLLKPKAGGLALALAALGEQLDGILDVTIVYPDGVPLYRDLWQGNIRQLGVDMRFVDLPRDLMDNLLAGKFNDDAATKQAMFDWLDDIWQQKDARIEQMLADFAQ